MVSPHIDALYVVLSQKISGDGGAIGRELVSGLESGAQDRRPHQRLTRHAPLWQLYAPEIRLTPTDCVDSGLNPVI